MEGVGSPCGNHRERGIDSSRQTLLDVPETYGMLGSLRNLIGVVEVDGH